MEAIAEHPSLTEAAPAWNLACLDWEARLREGRSLVPDLPALNHAEGERAVRVFDKLRLADVAGTPTMADAGGEWFRNIVRALFGALDPVTRQRMIRELFLLVPKKNSKTTNGALLMLTALLLNQRPNAPFILTAPVQDVAEIAFKAVRGAIDLDLVLTKKLHVRDHLKTVIHRETKAELQIMTFDPSVLTGQKIAGCLIDELHVSAKMARASSAIRQLRGGMLPFPEAFMAFITTQSEEAPAGVFKAELEKARAIRDGRQAGVMLPVLYEFPEAIQKNNEAWRDPKIWHWVSPNHGRSVTIPRLIEEMETAENTNIEELRAWASQHLDIQIGLALKADRWYGADYWEARADEDIDSLEKLIELCEVIDVGIDGGGLDDLLGFAAVGRRKGGEGWLAWTHAWAHEGVLERRKTEAPKLRDFEKDGHLTIYGDMGSDIEQLAEYVAKIERAGKLDKIGIDPAGIGLVLDAIVKKFDKQKDKDSIQEKVIGISQGWKMTGVIKTTERKLAEKTLTHGGQPMMNWCVGNAKTTLVGNATTITKQAAGTAKIDPLMALFDAVALLSLNPPAPKVRKYQVVTVGRR